MEEPVDFDPEVVALSESEFVLVAELESVDEESEPVSDAVCAAVFEDFGAVVADAVGVADAVFSSEC